LGKGKGHVSHSRNNQFRANKLIKVA